MIEGVTNTVYSDAANIRPRLMTVGGAVSIAGAAETALNVVDANRFGYLTLLEAVCTVAGTTAGTWTLRNRVGGSTLLVLQQPITTSVVGTRYCWAFPVPWKTEFVNNSFSIQGSAATLGTWVFLCNGFMSAT